MKPGDYIAWKWGNGLAQGRVKSIHKDSIIITSKGKEVKRNGSSDNPAVVIEHKSGNDVLKLVSEIQKTNKD
ncbi:MAG: hypothetical protein JWN28_97 [Candidatus Saccharibacteria bacterium]|nr:hypothetical protein [Candidatus Saccharibacteria bacterium]